MAINKIKEIVPLSVRRLRRGAICAAVAALLSACANLQGIEAGAPLKAPADYASAGVLPGQGGEWPDASWLAGIGGAPLQGLAAEALAGNPGLQVAAARVAAARALVDAAGAASRPQVGASFATTRERFTENSIYPPPFGGAYVTDNELALTLSYDLDFWGRHRAQLRSALSQNRAAEAEEYAARLLLSTSVARAWVQLARASAQLDLTRQQAALREQLLRLTRQRYAAGLDTQSEDQQSRLQAASLGAEQARLNEAIALGRNQLAALLGQGPDRGLRIAAPALVPALVADAAPALPEQLPLGLLGRRPDIVAARWQVEAAQSDIKVAQTAFYPNVNLSAMLGLSSLGWSNFLSRGSMVDGIGPAIHLPIFEGGALRAQLKGRVAAYDAAVATYNQALAEALHEVADRVQSLRAADLETQSQQAASEAAERGMQLAQQRQQVGTDNMLQVLAARIAYLSQRKLELDARARRLDLRIGLIKSLGGGFDAAAAGLAPAAPANPATRQPPLANAAP